jgi:hypothetical protein
MPQNDQPSDRYQEAQLPTDLFATYQRFIKAALKPARRKLLQFCLAGSVDVTEAKRDEKSSAYGKDMNVPFMTTGFDSTIVSISKKDDDCYLIRTNTSAVYFVRTASTGWKIYAYRDKPIQ